MQSSIKVNCQRRVVRCSQARHDGSQDVAIIINEYFVERSRERPMLKAG